METKNYETPEVLLLELNQVNAICEESGFDIGGENPSDGGSLDGFSV